MTSTTINFRAAARDFCREKHFTNVDLIEAAMIRGAELMAEQATKLVKATGQNIRADHALNQNPDGKPIAP